jgi:hypothetical protein
VSGPASRGAVAAVVAGFLTVSGCGTGNSGSMAPTTTLSITSVDPNVGLVTGGTSVVVKGGNFEDGATVAFGSEPATSVFFNNASSLTVGAPALASYQRSSDLRAPVATVAISITTPDRTSVIKTDAFTYYECLPENGIQCP